jgi:hypothetical protein
MKLRKYNSWHARVEVGGPFVSSCSSDSKNEKELISVQKEATTTGVARTHKT